MSYLIPYLGGKTRLAKTIISRMPVHTCYVEVFAGGAAVFFQKSPVETEVLNDRDSDLVSLPATALFRWSRWGAQLRYTVPRR